MIRRFGVVLGGALLLTTAFLAAQGRPDFTGHWVLSSQSGIFCSPSLKIVHDEKTLTLDFAESQRPADSRTPATPAPRLVRFDGLDARQPVRPDPSPSPSTPHAGWNATTTAVVSRAAWNGDQLVIVTHRTLMISWPDRLPVEVERQHTFKETMVLDGNELVVDHLAILDPLPGGTTKRIDAPPTSWQCRYRKAG